MIHFPPYNVGGHAFLMKYKQNGDRINVPTRLSRFSGFGRTFTAGRYKDAVFDIGLMSVPQMNHEGREIPRSDSICSKRETIRLPAVCSSLLSLVSTIPDLKNRSDSIIRRARVIFSKEEAP